MNRKEYKRLWRLARGMKPRESPEKRFFQKVKKTDNCWIWTAQKTKGYGRFHQNSKVGDVMAHRFSYELEKGKIPDGLYLDHLCRNRGCVNPKHLEPVTNKENILRGNGLCAKNAKKKYCPKCRGKWTQEKDRRYCVPCRKEYKRNWYRDKIHFSITASIESRN